MKVGENMENKKKFIEELGVLLSCIAVMSDIYKAMR